MLRITTRAILLLSGIIFLQAAPLAGYATETCDYGTKPDDGLVVFSGTVPSSAEHNKIFGPPGSFMYTYNRTDGNFLTRSDVRLMQWSLLHGDLPSDFTDGGNYGRLFVLRLKAGDYEFDRWSYGSYNGGGQRVAVGIKPLKFTVEAQHAVYLGNFDPIMFTYTFSSGRTWPQPWLTVRNKSSRDLGVFLKKCPNFDVSQIDVRVMDPTPWIARKK